MFNDAYCPYIIKPVIGTKGTVQSCHRRRVLGRDARCGQYNIIIYTAAGEKWVNNAHNNMCNNITATQQRHQQYKGPRGGCAIAARVSVQGSRGGGGQM